MRVFVFPPSADFPMLRAATLEAERAGFDGVLVADHLWMFGAPRLEAVGTIAALASVTTRIRLCAAVLTATFRPPAVTARAVATIHEISGGRFRAGIGAGADAAEHERSGLPFGPPGERLRLMERTIRAIRDACADVPLVVGASGDRALALVARHADEWNCGAMYLDRIGERVRAIDALTAGRDRPLLRSVNLPLTVGSVPEGDAARRYNLGLGMSGDHAAMVQRAREVRELGFDGVWLGAHSPAAFERALALLPDLKEL